MQPWINNLFLKRATHLSNRLMLLVVTVFSVTLFATPQSDIDAKVQTEVTTTHAPFTLTPYFAHYDGYARGKKLGKAQRHLFINDDGSYTFKFTSKLRFLLFSDERRETVTFSYNDTAIEPLTYEYSRKGTGSNKHLKLTFDANDKRIITSTADTVIEYQQQWDNQSYFIDLKQQLSLGKTVVNYTIIDHKGRQKTFEVHVLGSEQVKLPFGTIDSIKVQVIGTNTKRATYAWFSPRLNYTLVKLVQQKSGKEQGRVELRDYAEIVEDTQPSIQ